MPADPACHQPKAQPMLPADDQLLVLLFSTAMAEQESEQLIMLLG